MNHYRRLCRSSEGFSLVEIMISAGLLMLLVLGSATLLQRANQASGARKVAVAHDALVQKIRKYAGMPSALLVTFQQPLPGSSANAQYRACVDTNAADCTNLGGPYPLEIFDPLLAPGTYTTVTGTQANPVYYDSTGTRCASTTVAGSTALCPWRVFTSFQPQCGAVFTGSPPIASTPATCDQAETITVNYSVTQVVGAPVGNSGTNISGSATEGVGAFKDASGSVIVRVKDLANLPVPPPPPVPALPPPPPTSTPPPPPTSLPPTPPTSPPPPPVVSPPPPPAPPVPPGCTSNALTFSMSAPGSQTSSGSTSIPLSPCPAANPLFSFVSGGNCISNTSSGGTVTSLTSCGGTPGPGSTCTCSLSVAGPDTLTNPAQAMLITYNCCAVGAPPPPAVPVCTDCQVGMTTFLSSTNTCTKIVGSPGDVACDCDYGGAQKCVASGGTVGVVTPNVAWRCCIP